MNKKTLLASAMVMLCAAVPAIQAADEDPVIMTINGKPILRSEFEYSYNKNNGADVIDHKTVEELTINVRWKRLWTRNMTP